MGLADSGIMPPMKYWEIIADKLSVAGWSWAIPARSPERAGVGLSAPREQTVPAVSQFVGKNCRLSRERKWLS